LIRYIRLYFLNTLPGRYMPILYKIAPNRFLLSNKMVI
jgi:hypothetical protein